MVYQGISRVPYPKNEPVFSFSPGLEEKKRLKEEMIKQKDQKTKIPLVIGGDKLFDGSLDEIRCPHDHRHVLALAVQARSEHADLAVEKALEARKSWSGLPWEDRASVFLRAADLLTSRYREQINAATMLAQSKTCFQAEIDAVCEMADFFRFNVYFAEQIYREQPLVSPSGLWNRSEARGLEGFVLAIGPFNFTSISMNLAAAPALMGCAVVWKPAPQALLASYYLLNILEEAGLPPGVINLIHTSPQIVSQKLLSHPEMAGIHFTGSTQTFDNLWSQCASNLSRYRQYPRIVGETGGKDFIFASPCADAKQLTAALIRGAFEYQGQKCSAASRAYIPKELWKKIKEPLLEQTRQIKIGDPFDFQNFMGAVIDERAYKKIKGYIDRARSSQKANILVGGEADDQKGYFIRPTIIEALDPHYETMEEEIFGPVLSVFIYDEADLEKTVNLVRTTSPYALTGAIFATDRRAIHDLTAKLTYEAGNFYINDKPTGAVVGQQPFGGSRRSGTNDKAGSVANLARWVSFRTIKENFMDIHDYRYPFMKES